MLVPVLTLVFAVVSGENNHNTESRKGQEVHSKNSRIDRDSYIDAYTESHGGIIESNNINTDREMNFPTGFPGGFPDEHFGVQYPYPAPSHPQQQYGPPQQTYGPPQQTYGPPQQMYGPPHPPAYGPPRPPYGPPQPSYGPPPFPTPNYGPPAPPVYGIPYAILGILDKFKLKFELITIFKILLKIVLFKKLVSFIAIICLLLFIPWLKAKKAIHHHGGGGGGGGVEHDEENDLMMRKIDGQSSQGNDRLNNITVYVLEAIENFTKYDPESSDNKCDSTYCTVDRIARNISEKVAYQE